MLPYFFNFLILGFVQNSTFAQIQQAVCTSSHRHKFCVICHSKLLLSILYCSVFSCHILRVEFSGFCGSCCSNHGFIFRLIHRMVKVCSDISKRRSDCIFRVTESGWGWWRNNGQKDKYWPCRKVWGNCEHSELCRGNRVGFVASRCKRNISY